MIKQLLKWFIFFPANYKSSKNHKYLVTKFWGNKIDSFTVNRGIFKGIILSKHGSYGSSFLPKVTGYYEHELENEFKLILEDAFTNIVVIGAAEGYYAVGLAKKKPDSNVFAFDISKKALKLCLLNKVLNDAKNLTISGVCSQTHLIKLCRNTKSLVICDIEGDEDALFSEIDPMVLQNTTLVIELHELANMGVTDKLRSIFESTHHITSVFSEDDVYKQNKIQNLNGKSVTNEECYMLLREKRQHIMQWFICRPKLN